MPPFRILQRKKGEKFLDESEKNNAATGVRSNFKSIAGESSGSAAFL